MNYIQIAVLVCGLGALLLLTTETRWRRYGSIVGLIGQPFWMYATWQAGQAGAFLLSLMYAAVYARASFVVWKEEIR